MATFIFLGVEEAGQLNAKLDRLLTGNAQILSSLQLLTAQGKIIMADLTTLTADVTTETTVMESAETLITGLAAQITAAGTDPVALKALTTTMETNASTLAAAVAANTPAPASPLSA